MRVTITKLRQDIFRLVEKAMQGEALEFTHKGVVFQVVPESRPSKLEGLVGLTVVAPQADIGQAKRDLFDEMQAEWEQDWAEI